jgi:3-dehydroquinate synthetase/ABC-type branched-subunit amino acid transport system ATPase component
MRQIPVTAAGPAFRVGSVSLGVEGRPLPYLKVSDFVLPSAGTYTLEGPNGSGKSTFIQLITATLPEEIKSDQLPGIEIEGRVVQIKTPSDAIKAGIITVFQDDELIASMSVFENLVLRHSAVRPRDFAQYGWGIVFNLQGLIGSIVAFFGNAVPRGLRAAIARVLPGTVDWRGEDRIRKDAEHRLAAFGPNMAEILDRTPQRLSGGEMAVAKLLAAQLYKNTKVLILDEAFSGLQRDVWPFLVDQTKHWADSIGATVIAISHNPDELARWQPRMKFEIRAGQLQVLDRLEYANLRRGVPGRNTLFPVFEVPSDRNLRGVVYRELWKRVGDKSRYVFLVDEDACTEAAEELIDSKPAGLPKLVLSLVAVEGGDFTAEYKRLTEKILKFALDEDCVICIIGGGLNLNSGAFIASTVNRGQLATVLVPTTLLAMADVAVGSKTSVDFGLGTINELPAPVNRKHTVGTYFNPTAVLLDPRYLESLPPMQFKIGLVECLKHGILQAPDLLKEVMALMSSSNVPSLRAFEVAKQTLELKSETLELDPFEEGYAKILLYGHLHAHCLERIIDEPLAHGLAVLLGMAIDANLTASVTIESMLVALIRSTELTPPSSFFTFNLSIMRQVYESSNKAAFRSGHDFKVLRVPEYGQFAIASIRDQIQLRNAVGQTDFSDFAYSVVKEHEVIRSWPQIEAAYATVRAQVVPPTRQN